jgi:hypothetical protein
MCANAVVFEHWVELETLQAQEKPSVEQTSRLKALERKVEVTISDKKTFTQLSGVGIAFGLIGIFLGLATGIKRFSRWLIRWLLLSLSWHGLRFCR